MADILYVYKTSIYANLTNKCPCRCTFCIRNRFGRQCRYTLAQA